ncbi:anti-sigma B factor RsbW [Aneurinibacillus terranovensis]|uniref:anti-sigma B factor RsbW n=1 Tax=Aneurinibacillus terranovensis TaxID=278991 RepID=UPI000403A59B|nr:anti-sigma B factor RsbW [Aneurinibacillus terranovensis]
MPNTHDSIKLIVPARADYIGVIRLTVSGLAHQMGFSYNDIEDIKVAVAEACNNVVRHAYQQADGEITIDINVQMDQLEVVVCDKGPSFDVDKIENKASSLHGKNLDEVDIGGLGIYLMKTLMDEVKYDSSQGGVKVTLLKSLIRDEVNQGEPDVRQQINQY